MIFLVPYEIETLQQESPWANWLLVTTSSLISLFALFSGGFETGSINALILDGFSLPGLFAHIFLHADLMHLLGNMIFLWVFGNAVCSNIGNLLYLALVIALTLFSATIHNLLDGSPAIGASGMINGIVGLVLAMYPLNRVYLFFLFIIKGGSCSCKAWHIILLWFAFDIWGALFGGGLIAYWAHLGGLFSGITLGLIALQRDWIRLTEADNRCLLEIIKKETWD